MKHLAKDQRVPQIHPRNRISRGLNIQGSEAVCHDGAKMRQNVANCPPLSFSDFSLGSLSLSPGSSAPSPFESFKSFSSGSFASFTSFASFGSFSLLLDSFGSLDSLSLPSFGSLDSLSLPSLVASLSSVQVDEDVSVTSLFEGSNSKYSATNNHAHLSSTQRFLLYQVPSIALFCLDSWPDTVNRLKCFDAQMSQVWHNRNAKPGLPLGKLVFGLASGKILGLPHQPLAISVGPIPISHVRTLRLGGAPPVKPHHCNFGCLPL